MPSLMSLSLRRNTSPPLVVVGGGPVPLGPADSSNHFGLPQPRRLPGGVGQTPPPTRPQPVAAPGDGHPQLGLGTVQGALGHADIARHPMPILSGHNPNVPPNRAQP